eukprot:GHVL01019451.1.p1 GENE.GHVL01019451.1~~GHVL01019451.1.p1  ORF type:complete len:435 (+),score=63.48 GHVL01019451.1:180-1484(+)
MSYGMYGIYIVYRFFIFFTFLQSLTFLVLEHKLFELLCDEKHNEALQCLRDELATSAFDEESVSRVHDCCCWFMCNGKADLKRSYELSNENLWKRLVNLFPPSIMISNCRLADLLHQATELQDSKCMFHKRGTRSPPSLLTDHSCNPSALPCRCAAVLDGHGDEVWFVTVSHDNKTIASSSRDRSIILWDAQDKKYPQKITLRGHEEACSCIVWSPNDKYLASASNDKTVMLWTPDKDYPIQKFLQHSESVTSVSWLSDSIHFVSAGFDRCVYLWRTNHTIEKYRWRFTSRIHDCAVNYDSTKLIVVPSDRTIRIIDLKTKEEISCIAETEHISCICASSRSDEILVGINHQIPTIRLWNVQEQRIVQRYQGHLQGRFVVRASFGGSDERYVVSGSEDALVYIWHRSSGALLRVLPGHAGTVNSVCWNRSKDDM